MLQFAVKCRFDIKEKAYNYELTTDAPFWKKDGYLVLNFDIKTINNGTDHLTYGGGTQDQWLKEGQRTTTIVGDKIFDTDISVPVKSGDIAIIDLDNSVSDKYEVSIFQIN